MAFQRKYPLYYNIPWDDCGSGGYRKPEEVIKHHYVATDGKYIYRLVEKSHSYEFERLKETEPKIRLSNFEGCPHFYGTMYMPNGDSFELQVKITKEYLDEAHQMRGDWNGYRENDWTARFLNRQSIMSAFNLFKNIVGKE